MNNKAKERRELGDALIEFAKKNYLGTTDDGDIFCLFCQVWYPKPEGSEFGEEHKPNCLHLRAKVLK